MSITKEMLLNYAKPDIKEIDVPGIGILRVRPVSELRRSQRQAQYFKPNGQADDLQWGRRRLHRMIDQLVDEKGDPLFTDNDIPELVELDSHRLDAIYGALIVVDSAFEGNAPGELSDSESSSPETTD